MVPQTGIDQYGNAMTNTVIPGANGQHDNSGAIGTDNQIVGGMVQSGLRAGTGSDDPWLQFWGGQATPGALQTQLAPAAQSGYVNGLNGAAGGAQNSLLAQLAAQSRGLGPSLSTQQMQAGMQQNIRGQAALAASGRNPGMASYGAMQGAGAANQQTAQGAAMARTQEQLNAQMGLAGLANQMQGSSLANAGMQQQVNLANVGAQNQFGLAQGQLNQNALQYYNTMMANQLGSYNSYLQNKDLQVTQDNNKLKGQAVGAGIAAGGGLAQMAGM